MLRYRTPVSLAAAAAILVGVMASPAFESSKGAEAKRACLGILLSSALLWCVEAMDTYATSMAIPFLVVTLRALNDAEGNRLSSPDAMKRVFSVIFSQTIMLLLGGFAMASALSKHLIAKRLAIAVLKKV